MLASLKRNKYPRYYEAFMIGKVYEPLWEENLQAALYEEFEVHVYQNKPLLPYYMYSYVS